MGGRLLNEFSWSYSRHNTFSECQKKYWYSYYGSWEGWPKTPYDSRPSIDPLAAHLYQLKQIQSVAMFVGSCVHKAIEECLKERFNTLLKNTPPTVEELQKKAVAAFRKGVEETKKGAYRVHPKKHSNLFEWYFREDETKDPFTEELMASSEEKIKSCLANWIESPIAKMAFQNEARWISIEQLDSFFLGDYKILVVIDFAMEWIAKSGKKTLILFDWKTGQPTPKTDEQLLSYALFATKTRKTALQDIILTPFYVAHNAYFKIGTPDRPIEEASLQAAEEMMRKSCATMAEKIPTLIPKAEDPQPDPRQFPYTTKRASCKFCPFQKVCQAADYKELSTEELRALVQQPKLEAAPF